MDSEGTVWRTFCDGQLFLETDAAQSITIKRPIAAVSASVSELLLAWICGELPSGTYAATKIVPFVHPDTPTLSEKFSTNMPDADFDRLWNSVAWYAKIPWIAGLEPAHVRELFSALPQIMADFRANISKAACDRELMARIDSRYISAFRQVA
jgi:hypothetical protein